MPTKDDPPPIPSIKPSDRPATEVPERRTGTVARGTGESAPPSRAPSLMTQDTEGQPNPFRFGKYEFAPGERERLINATLPMEPPETLYNTPPLPGEDDAAPTAEYEAPVPRSVGRKRHFVVLAISVALSLAGGVFWAMRGPERAPAFESTATATALPVTSSVAVSPPPVPEPAPIQKPATADVTSPPSAPPPAVKPEPKAHRVHKPAPPLRASPAAAPAAPSAGALPPPSEPKAAPSAAPASTVPVMPRRFRPENDTEPPG